MKPTKEPREKKPRVWKGWSVVPHKITFMTPSVFFTKRDAVECKQACGDHFEVIKVKIIEEKR